MSALPVGEAAAAVRRGAGLVSLPDRGLLAVRGGDRVRWLEGMVSNEVGPLGEARSGCQALVLTRTGRVVADLHVLWRPDELWLELDAAALAPARSHLERFIIADDVALEDRSAAWKRLALEGPAAGAVLEAASAPLPEIAPDGCADVGLGGVPVIVARYGWSGEPGYQLFVPAEALEDTRAALVEAGAPHGLLEAEPEVLEILRIEAGIPRYGHELDESVLPDEARLEQAVSTTKGCYTGQEVVARLRSRGQVGHLLVGLTTDGNSPLPSGEPVVLGESRIGEVTSSCVSPRAGSIALAFVKRRHAEAGTGVSVAGRGARVATLPFAAAGAGAP